MLRRILLAGEKEDTTAVKPWSFIFRKFVACKMAFYNTGLKAPPVRAGLNSRLESRRAGRKVVQRSAAVRMEFIIEPRRKAGRPRV